MPLYHPLQLPLLASLFHRVDLNYCLVSPALSLKNVLVHLGTWFCQQQVLLLLFIWECLHSAFILLAAKSLTDSFCSPHVSWVIPLPLASVVFVALPLILLGLPCAWCHCSLAAFRSFLFFGFQHFNCDVSASQSLCFYPAYCPA